MQYRYQVASDVVRDGLGVELIDDDRNGRWGIQCDANSSLTISLFSEGLPFTEVEKLMRVARSELGQLRTVRLCPPLQPGHA
jgi:hypothetical protein